MPNLNNIHLALGITGASGVYAAELLIDKSPWPVDIIISKWGKNVYIHERGPFDRLQAKAAAVYDNEDLSSPPASGSVPTAGMVILPCSVNTLGSIASGLCDNLISRAAHCHLKEHRPLILCLRETPLSGIDLNNAHKISSAGGIIMPISPPFYMFKNQNPDKVSMTDLLSLFVDRVLSALGHPAETNWKNIK